MVLYTEFKGAALDARNKVEQVLRNKIREECNLSGDQVVVRELRPYDLDSALSPEWTFAITPASAWTTMIDNKTIADNRFVGVYGLKYVKQGDQAVSQIKVTRMGKTVRYYHVQGTNITENQTVYFDDPFTVDQNTTLTVEGYGVTAGATEKMIFLGLVAEKKGLLVSD